MQSNFLFSICTEIYNREKTLLKTLFSIKNQSFQNFEYIIFENGSTDNSLFLINKFLKKYPNFSKKVKLINSSNKISDIKSWNTPIREASGQYIVVCEGDDWFFKKHLEIVSKKICESQKIGLIVTSNSKSSTFRKKITFLNKSSKVMFHELINFNFCPPPSETIFLRELNGKKFLYDENNFIYAAEYSILHDILSHDLEVIFIDSMNVYRGVKKKIRVQDFKHIQDDYYCLFFKWKKYYNLKKFNENRNKVFKKLIKILAQEIVWLKIDKILLTKFYEECMYFKKFPILLLLKFIWMHCLIQIKYFIKKLVNFV